MKRSSFDPQKVNAISQRLQIMMHVQEDQDEVRRKELQSVVFDQKAKPSWLLSKSEFALFCHNPKLFPTASTQVKNPVISSSLKIRLPLGATAGCEHIAEMC